LRFGEKYSLLDNYKTLASETPGVGQYNIKLHRKFNKDSRDPKFYKKKHMEEETEKRAKTAQLGPFSYQPVPAAFDTFYSIQRNSIEKTAVIIYVM
jgi:hypothetical protein